ncbi:flavodoxin family protein [Marinicella litoralis]|uniref:NADPH-dependent FMN reductase n=1 Tax=Marinicella litoralis TaxID=644220 RepID=A0A4V3DI31_9GAMM|nr:NAD(P)H-dependent oxidoreductase [Marinicella litoralis]TDR20531.1 NADPH-dependent FMN reductase [Marinicella litoralis]
MTGIILQGSSRSDGDTAAVVKQLAQLLDYEIIDLRLLNFSDYDYLAENSHDEFLPTVRHIVAHYDHIVWATPVYWYSMSALMKRFLDRISDCLRIEKETGRQFRGMSMSLISVSNDERNEAFETPFILTADYLGMSYLGDQHVIVGNDHDIKSQLTAIVRKLKSC